MTIVQQARFFAAITMPGASVDCAGSGRSPCGRGWTCAAGACTAEARRRCVICCQAECTLVASFIYRSCVTSSRVWPNESSSVVLQSHCPILDHPDHRRVTGHERFMTGIIEPDPIAGSFDG